MRADDYIPTPSELLEAARSAVLLAKTIRTLQASGWFQGRQSWIACPIDTLVRGIVATHEARTTRYANCVVREYLVDFQRLWRWIEHRPDHIGQVGWSVTYVTDHECDLPEVTLPAGYAAIAKHVTLGNGGYTSWALRRS
jgi:hypothetical protein